MTPVTLAAVGKAYRAYTALNLFGEKRTVCIGRDGPRWTASGPGVPVVDVTEAENGRQA